MSEETILILILVCNAITAVANTYTLVSMVRSDRERRALLAPQPRSVRYLVPDPARCAPVNNYWPPRAGQ